MSESYLSMIRKMSLNLKYYFIASFFAYLGLGAGNVLVNLFLMEKGYGENVVGVFLSIKLFTTGILALPAGILCNRMGYKWSLKKGLFFIGIGIIILTYFNGLVAIYLSSFLWGLGLSVFAVSAPPFIQDNAEMKHRQQAFSINFSVMMFSNMMGNYISGKMAEVLPYGILKNYQVTLTVFALSTFIGIIFLANIKEKVKGEEKFNLKNHIVGITSLVKKDNNIVRLLLCHGIIGMGAGLIVPLLNVFLKNNVGATTSQIGTIMSLSQTTTAIAGLITPYIVLRLGKVKTVTTLRLLSIPFLIAIALLQNIYLVAIAVFVRSSLMNMTHPAELEFSMGLVGKNNRAFLSALLKTVESVGRSFSVLAGGYIMANLGYSLPYYITCCLYFIAVILFYSWFNSVEIENKITISN
ncbi:MFS transporter [Anaerobranca gottschalkii]|uniref:Predicted arabinose efflux permease, MFS family n=1 Tax=Anaerobranca gottschalkii DSM 13577 TaxID=1120990 RepID=A0A1H9ZR70_9FIRM|nr:MFS transporter [Anaerobranca gottschalkii]SES84196.1 Predicted arabinose efflux permease, MFS family [Anaerobranca gottschalkii DSM 13577]